MNIYKILNEVIMYIEESLDKEIDYKKLAKIAGLNIQTLQNIFMLITNVGLAEYIRNRRLSSAAEDLSSGSSVMDVAIKYQYTSAIAFSRSFTKFHKLKPSEVKNKNVKWVNYPILNFDEDNKSFLDMSYRIERKDEFSLYGVKIVTDKAHISHDAPTFFKNVQNKYKEIYGNIEYGMVLYEKRFNSKNLEYWCLYKNEYDTFEKISFPKTKWLIFKIDSKRARDIQNLSYNFYNTFFPKSKFKLKDIPELEFYGENYTEFMVAIE